MKPNPSTDSGWLPAILAGVALFVSFGALSFRADATGDLAYEKVLDWLILGPLWASVVFLCLRFETRGLRKGRAIARSAGIATWIAVSSVGHWWAEEKIEYRERAPRLQCINNMRQIGLAFASYAVANGGYLPPAYIPDKEGRPIHSWRALILPYMEPDARPPAYRWDEPWNGLQNSKVDDLPIAQSFHCPQSASLRGETDYTVVVGPRTPFPGSDSRSLNEIKQFNGGSDTILFVEVANSGINWLEPRDFEVEDEIRDLNPNGRPGRFRAHHGIVRAAFADGHIAPITAEIKPDVLRQFLQIPDGRPAHSP